MATQAMIEAAARALCKRHGKNPDWPIGVDKNGYHQEPFIKTVPSWQWFFEHDAKAALEAAEAAAWEPMPSEYRELIIAALKDHPGPWRQNQTQSIKDANSNDVFDAEFGLLPDIIFILMLNFPEIAAAITAPASPSE